MTSDDRTNHGLRYISWYAPLFKFVIFVNIPGHWQESLTDLHPHRPSVLPIFIVDIYWNDVKIDRVSVLSPIAVDISDYAMVRDRAHGVKMIRPLK